MFRRKLRTYLYRLVSSLLAWSLLSLGVSPGSNARADGPVTNPDPHLPPFAAGKIDPSTYLRLRAEAIARLRGLPYSDPGARVRAIQALDQQEQSMQPIQSPDISSTAWTPIGPAPIPNGQTTPTSTVSGRVTAIAIHPLTPTIVYVGTAQGGLFRTLDGGTTWTPLMDGAATLAIGAVTIDPLNPSTVFVGTGEGNLSNDSFFGVGLYRITNADTSPILAGPFETRIAGTGTLTSTGHAFLGTSINKIVVDPSNDNRIYVGNTQGYSGSSGDFAASPALLGLYFSANALATTPTFSRVSGVPGLGAGGVTDIVFEPSSSNNLLVGVQDFSLGGLDGIYRATNASVAPGASPVFTRTLAPGVFVNSKLAINKVGITVTVVSAYGYASGGKLVKSTDGGQTWPITTTSFAGLPGFCDGQCWYDIALAMDPTNANKIYLGGSADGDNTNSSILVKSTNGTTFVRSEAGLHADEHALAVAPSNPSIVYTGNDGGVWKSIDSGANWTSLNNSGLNTVQFESIAVHPSDRNFTIGGTQDNGTNWYKPDGTWTRADFGDGGFALIDQSAANTTTVTMYHTYFNQTNNFIGLARVFSTSNASDGNWEFLGCGFGTLNGINCSDTTLFYAPMALGPGSPNTLYFGTDTLYRSANQGTNMTAVSQAPLSFGGPVSAIGISPQNDSVRIVGTKDGLVFATTTGANPLIDVTPFSMPVAYVARAVIDPNNSKTAYVTFDGYGFTNHIWKTTSLSTEAAAWAPTNFNVDVPVNAFVVDPANSQNLYAGTDIGVYASSNGGISWAPLGTGLPRVAVFDMAIQNSHRILRIATHGRGMWEISLPPVADLSIVKKVTPAFGPPGQAITYTLTYSNVGPSTAANILITDVVPITVTAISFTSSGTTITPTGNLSYTWQVADLVAGAGGFITITGIISPNLVAIPAIIVNTATITTTTPDAKPLNNTSTVSFTVPPQADVSIVKKVTPALGPPGQPITYTLTYSNVGPSTATNILITDVVPITITAISFTSSGTTVTPTGNLSYTWQVADLVPGAGGIITITGIISPNLISGAAIIVNTATITTTTPDTKPLNNSSSVNFALPPQADLSIVKKVTPALGPPGQAISYTLTYSNVGPSTAANILITDVVPITVTAISFTSSGTTITATGNLSYTWQVADLVPGAGGIITITGIISPSLVSIAEIIVNTATITTTTLDTKRLNNSSGVNFTAETVLYLFLPLVMR